MDVETISDHRKVMLHLLRAQNRRITDAQMNAIDAAFKGRTDADAAGTPLWLTIVAQVVARWASYDGVKFAIQPSVRGLIIDLFMRLEEMHGKFLVRSILGFVTLCGRSGVSEMELCHLAALDDNVLADVYQWWVPPLRTCPPLVIARLLADLEPYLSCRGDGSGQELLKWYHRQFWESAEHYLFEGTNCAGTVTSARASYTAKSEFPSRALRHAQLADFFAGTWAGRAKPYSSWLAERVQRHQFFPGETGGDRMVPAQPLVISGRLTSPECERLLNTRRIDEYVYHAIRCGDAASVQTEMCSLEYVAAKIAAGRDRDLVKEYADAIETLFDSDPEPADLLMKWMAFVGRHLDVMHLNIPMIPFQLAFQEPDTSDLHRKFLSLAEKGDDPRIVLSACAGAGVSQEVWR